MSLIVIMMVFRDIFVGKIVYGPYHIIGKATFLLGFLGMGLYARYKVTREAPALMFGAIFFIFLNCAHGLSYEPGYHMGYNLTLLIALLVYNRSSLGFLGILIFGFVTLLLTVVLSGIQPNEKYLADWQSHIIVDFIVLSVVVWIIYQGILKGTQERETLYGQYLEIGRKTSMIVHDLKGGLSSPSLYVGLLRSRLAKLPRDPEIEEVLSKLHDDLAFLKAYALELAQFSSGTDFTTLEFFKLSEIVKSVKTLAVNELSNVRAHIEGDYEIRANKNLLRRIFFNAFLNAAEACLSSTEVLTVTVRVEGNTIYIEDDGLGFTQEVLKKIKKGQAVTTKKNGSGLGCRIMREYVKLMKGKIEFDNRAGKPGAFVAIHLPEATIERLSETMEEITDAPV